MSRRGWFIFCFIFTDAASFHLFEDNGKAGELSSNCVRCICEVLDCPKETSCDNSTACGPLRITYWTAPFHENGTALKEYRHCTLNAHCATQTFQSFMRRFLPKCVKESDYRSVCETALSLHQSGHLHCSRAVGPALSAALAACLHRRARAWIELGSTLAGDT